MSDLDPTSNTKRGRRDDPLYSVVIPTFDRRDRLVEAIDSVLAQDFRDLEIVVIDDGSRDDTAMAMGRYGDVVRYIWQPNQGQSAARNHGIRLSRGAFVALLDSDDLWKPGKIDHDLAVFAANPSADVIVGDAESVKRGVFLRASMLLAWGVEFETETRGFGDDLLGLSNGPLCPTPTMVFRRHVLDRLGPDVFDPTLRYNEDWDLEFRLFAGFKVLFSRQLVARCRWFDDHTHPFGLPNDARSAEEQTLMDRNILTILLRYCEQDNWGPKLRDEMRRRVKELSARTAVKSSNR